MKRKDVDRTDWILWFVLGVIVLWFAYYIAAPLFAVFTTPPQSF